ncbi:hypothetical protein AJ78_03566 [Emergomyces pasteurianus Ep9510]|uniref:Uncharacterized protein n=1 Tax=Emergomyces pasteurianus Ep9510 TaxID=1447872 RepID=A0A1J9Q7Q7_9EURO|nr:hypothetical protein AJ78_03566 [Emergomyces pasteurianus Ep9510]
MIPTFSHFSIPLPSVRLPTPSMRTSSLVIIGILPVAAPTAYLLYLRLTTIRHITSSTGRYHPIPTIDKSSSRPQSPSPSPSSPSSSFSSDPPPLPVTIPAHLPTSPSHIIMYERITSHPIPLTSLHLSDRSSASPSDNVHALLTTYLRTTMKAFSRTPQAYIIRSALRGNPAGATFDDSCIDALEFVPGDRVNGVYVVTYRGEGHHDGAGLAGLGERVEMKLETPVGYAGPGKEVEGMIIAGIEGVRGGVGKQEGQREVGDILLVNETWFWRGEKGKPVMLESLVGRWLHGLLAGWLVVKGMKAITV